MTRRHRWLLAALAALAVAAAVTVRIVTADHGRGPAGGIDVPGGRDRAAAACASVDDVYRLVAEDAPAEDVFDAAEKAEREGDRARDLDPKWTHLASGAAALLEGLRRDDARATRLGRQVLDSECARVMPGS